MRSLLLLFGFLYVTPWLHTPGFSQSEQIIKAIEGIVTRQARLLKVPGGAFGIVIDGKIVFKMTRGTRRSGGKLPVNSKTVFQIGSLSKPFAAMVMLKLQQKNKLRLDHPIKKYLPGRCSENECEGITIAHLLSHSSGIPVGGTNEAIEKNESYDSIATRALEAKKACAPGTCFQYNNVAYNLIAEIIEKVESRPYIDTLKAEILTPLKMNDTTASFTGLKQTGNYFVPHMLKKERFVPTTHASYWYSFPAAAGINSNLDDMLKFLSAELGSYPDVLSVETLNALHSPSIEAPDVYTWFDKPFWKDGMKSQYAFGHRLLTSPRLTVIYHSGWVKGCKCMMAFFPERKLGFVLVQNTDSDLGFLVLEEVVGYLKALK